jgi:hypothetical protein
MKKIKLFVSILLISSSVAYSQFNKGSVLLGTDLSFSTSTSNSGSNENKSHGFTVSPTVAIATKQNTFWGGSLRAGYSKNESQLSNTVQTTNGYGASLFCRKYKQVVGRLYAFAQSGLGAGFSKFKYENGPATYSEQKNYNVGVAITPGISVNVSKKVYLEAGFSNIAAVDYSWGTSSSYFQGNTTTGKSNGFSFSSSLGSFTNNLYFGFRFIIPKGS